MSVRTVKTISYVTFSIGISMGLISPRISRAADKRINLVDSGRVVQYTGQTPETLQAEVLLRGQDGWSAWQGADGQYMIAVEWSEPRLIAEAEIEFRHAIAQRGNIQVQYFDGNAETGVPYGLCAGDLFHGQWKTVTADWYAADRKVTFLIGDKIQQPTTAPAERPTRTAICTRKLRFLCGPAARPPIRYLRAYGPAAKKTARFEIVRLKDASIQFPLKTTVYNGSLLDDEEQQVEQAFVDVDDNIIHVSYVDNDGDKINHTIVTLREPHELTRGFSFDPADVVQFGLIRIPAMGFVIEHIGATRNLQTGYRPGNSIYDRIAAEPAQDMNSALDEIRHCLTTHPASNNSVTGLEKRLAQQAALWQGDGLPDTRMRCAEIELPEPVLNDLIHAFLATILETGSVSGDTAIECDWPTPAKWPVQGGLARGSMMIRCLDQLGLHERARAYLDAVLAHQSVGHFAGRYKDTPGVLAGCLRPKSSCSMLDHGIMLCLLNDHYRLTGDRAWYQGIAPRLVAACDYVNVQCNRDNHYCICREDACDDFCQSLLPAGALSDDPAWQWWYVINMYACRGMYKTGLHFSELNLPEAHRILEDAERMARDLQRCSLESMIRTPVERLRDGNYVPIQPMRCRQRARTLDGSYYRYNPAHLIDCGLYRPDSDRAEWILRDLEDHLFFGDLGGGVVSAESLPQAISIYLVRGQRKHALRLLFNSLAARLNGQPFGQPASQWVAASRQKDTPPVGTAMLDLPEAAAYLLAVRQLVVMEGENTLELMAGVPDNWLTGKRTLQLTSVPTRFGPFSLLLRASDDGRGIVIDLANPARNPPLEIRLHTHRPLQSVTVDGLPVPSFERESGRITLPGRLDKASLKISFEPAAN